MRARGSEAAYPLGYSAARWCQGRGARERGVKRLVLKHFAVQEGVEVEPMAEEVRSTYGGAGLIVGRDLLEISV